jgi:chemotaxis protein CheY-P-specific phosphatase CheC
VEGEALGRLLGLKMITACPEVIMRLAELANDSEEEFEAVDEYEFLSSSGLITEIIEEPFVVFTMKEESGKVVKMYWLTFVDSEFAMMSQYSALLGRKVTIEYSEVEIFDPRLKEYRNINIIEALAVN